MSTGGINWQTVNLPFATGLNQRSDDRARPIAFLDICKDVQFDEHGGIQTRLPFAALSNDIFGGGTLSNCRRIDWVNGELVVFTIDSVYSWNAQLAKWVLRGTHLAVAVTERVMFTTTGDQLDADRAELSGTIVYTWAEGAASLRRVFVAAIDKATGAVLLTPTTLTGATYLLPRVVALTTKILLFAHDISANLVCWALDPASPGTAIAGAPTTVLASVANSFYDVVKIDSQDKAVGAVRRTTTTSYTIFTVTAGLTVAASTKARTADGPLAVASLPGGGLSTQVIRGNGTNIQGDFITTATLADVTTGQAVGTAAGTPVNQIAAAYRSVQNGGAFRCYAFWSAQESTTAATWATKFNFVDSAGTIGTQAAFIQHLAPASRAFDHNGSVYLWMAFGGQSTFSGAGDLGFQSFQTQNTYFLYRDDQYLSNAKAVATHGGGLTSTTGHLSGVALTSGSTTYSWCGTERRRLELGGVKHVGFAARAPVDVTFEFDSNRARRVARLGAALYVAGGEIMQYDGVRLVEAGFHIYPWLFGLIDAGGGSMSPGDYAYKMTWRYETAAGELDRSTTATIGSVTVTGSSTSIPVSAPLTATHKTAVVPAVEVWRTAEDPISDSPFFLVSSQDPSALTNPNRYLPNDPTATTLPTFNDFAADATVIALEANPENDGVLENTAPPPAQIIVATDTRLFLGAVANDPDSVWYSRQRAEGEVAGFHETLRVPVPRPGGDMTAIAFHNETLTVFRETAIYAFPGEGFNNFGQGQNFGPKRDISLDVGAVSQESVAVTPLGTIFKSSKGWHMLTPGWSVQYIGGAVSDYDTETVHAVDVLEAQHQVRILTSGRMLVWDYLASRPESPMGQWGEWTISDGVHATMWQGTHVYLTATGPKQQQTSYAALTYGMDVERTWKLEDILQGASRCRKLQFLGEYRSAFLARVRVAYNYKRTGGVPDYVDDKAWSPSPTVVGGPLQLRHSPKRPICESITVRITAVTSSVLATRATATLAVPVQTSGTNWTATFQAVGLGELGNAVTLRLAFVVGTGSIDVRDHFAFDPATSSWSPAVGTIGVLVTGTPTVAQLEAAIVAGTDLATLSSADGTPSKVVNVAAMAALAVVTGAFTGGAFGSPTGEALKLTGLGLEVGVEPGLFRGLPAAQQQ
jgi:hypothetical protein